MRPSPGLNGFWDGAMKTIAIIPAGGAGKRMGGDVPKQYLSLAGIPVLVRTLRVFQSSPLIDEILLVVPEGDISDVRRDLVRRYRIAKVSLVLHGGRERQDSVRNALAHLRNEDERIIIHDGVRPFVTAELIERAIAGAKEFGAVTVGVPIRDTVKAVDAEGRVVKTVSREGLWLTQTPQAFRREVILAAYTRAEADRFYGTDDASLVERTGIPVRMISGDRDNIKVTMPEDLVRGEMILRRSLGIKAKSGKG
jgi:2-C-methyl-D-erythritol 4-phosphate cytidylyltransferase